MRIQLETTSPSYVLELTSLCRTAGLVVKPRTRYDSGFDEDDWRCRRFVESGQEASVPDDDM